MSNYQAEALKEITDKLEQGVKDIFSGENYSDYLKTMAKFYEYSASNSLLIYMQRPDASYVAGYGAWQKNFNRHVKRGEHGIKILAPCPYKQKMEMEKIDPVTQRAVIGADGKPETEVTEVTRAAFKPVTVFDVGQTEGEPLPQLGVNELTGDVEHYPEFFDALKQIAPFPVSFEKMPESKKGYCNYQEQRIAINEGMAEIQNIKTAIHEITHATLHNYYAEKEKNVLPENRKDQHTREVEAESVAYTVCQHYGIDTADYSFGYIAGWSSDRETKELKGSLTTIRETAAGLITSIDGKYRELAKEHEITLGQETKEAALENITVLRLKDDDPISGHRYDPGYRFESLNMVKIWGMPIDPKNYEEFLVVPHAEVGTFRDNRLNSLDVSDIVVQHQGDQDRAYYVDRDRNGKTCLTEIPDFIEQQRAAEKLSAIAEMSTKQRYNMIDSLNKPFMPEATMNERANALIDLVERDGQRFGDGERRIIVEYAEHVQDNQKLFSLVNELAEQGFEQKNGFVSASIQARVNTEIDATENKRIPSGLDPAIQPIVTIIWSESNQLRDGEQMPLAKANMLFQKLDAEQGDGYDKTKFSITYTLRGEVSTYEGRQDFGDGDGSLIDHIKGYHEHYAKDERWKNHVLHTDGPEAWQKDVAEREIILNEFVPYMQMHCNLAEMEQTATGALALLSEIKESNSSVRRTNIAYYNALQDYVAECRHELNTTDGPCQFPDCPKKEDFTDPELAAYKKQVQEEVRQEAAAAGMTVEEYAANDYEPLSFPQPVQEQTGTPAMDAIEEKVKRGEVISLMSMVEAAKTDRAAAKPEKKTSIKKQLEKKAKAPAEHKPATKKKEKDIAL